MTKLYPKNPQAWKVNLGDEVGLPNICDRNCAGCYDDFGSTSLRDSPPDRRRDLYKALGENWFPSTWKFKPKWRTAIQDHFKNSTKPKLFLFTGRGDPLFYLPCIEAYMKTYKELGYTGYASISTSASLLDKKKLNFLINIGIDEINFNLVATDFKQETLDKMKMVKQKMNVATELPLLSIYEEKLLENLSFLNSIGLSYLTLAVTRIYSRAGAEKLQQVLPEDTKITQLSEKEACIENEPMAGRIMKEIRRRGYNIPVFYQSSDGDVREAI